MVPSPYHTGFVDKKHVLYLTSRPIYPSVIQGVMQRHATSRSGPHHHDICLIFSTSQAKPGNNGRDFLVGDSFRSAEHGGALIAEGRQSALQRRPSQSNSLCTGAAVHNNTALRECSECTFFVMYVLREMISLDSPARLRRGKNNRTAQSRQTTSQVAFLHRPARSFLDGPHLFIRPYKHVFSAVKALQASQKRASTCPACRAHTPCRPQPKLTARRNVPAVLGWGVAQILVAIDEASLKTAGNTSIQTVLLDGNPRHTTYTVRRLPTSNCSEHAERLVQALNTSCHHGEASHLIKTPLREWTGSDIREGGTCNSLRRGQGQRPPPCSAHQSPTLLEVLCPRTSTNTR